ncbi:MAG: uracil-DNA glycosylase family protein [Alphaproteobacteria bacterium]|nr:uracil-DNA glycosylase family protein [Alphaproteobacteria bacterium]
MTEASPAYPTWEAASAAARACQACAADLAHGCRPVFQLHPDARVLLIGQAPGRKVHASGRPFTDASGDQLRRWLGMDEPTFYDPHQIALVPAGLCYPGTEKGADLPPRAVCAPLWHPVLLPWLTQLRLTVLIGRYAHALHPPNAASVAERVAAWRRDPTCIAIPHPSPRNRRWLRQHPWFEADVIPVLQQAVRAALA